MEKILYNVRGLRRVMKKEEFDKTKIAELPDKKSIVKMFSLLFYDELEKTSFPEVSMDVALFLVILGTPKERREKAPDYLEQIVRIWVNKGFVRKDLAANNLKLTPEGVGYVTRLNPEVGEVRAFFRDIGRHYILFSVSIISFAAAAITLYEKFKPYFMEILPLGYFQRLIN